MKKVKMKQTSDDRLFIFHFAFAKDPPATAGGSDL
jgi:hypothetical protein